ncbi:hypothetical protein HAX54_040285, partial [Datura stramonium]|nr:hypothetical protein [Datura stramonium]
FNQMVNFKDFASRPNSSTLLSRVMNDVVSPGYAHHYTNIASGLPSLAHRIVREEIRWGETPFWEAWKLRKNTVLKHPQELSISVGLISLEACQSEAPYMRRLVLRLTRCARCKRARYTLEFSIDLAFNLILPKNLCTLANDNLSALLVKDLDIGEFVDWVFLKRDCLKVKVIAVVKIIVEECKNTSVADRDADLVMAEIHDVVDSPSRTLTILLK